MQALFSKLLRIADSEASVLLTGKSGSGKDLAARAIHKYSRRAQQPLVAINFLAMPRGLNSRTNCTRTWGCASFR
ncbi:MAG: sigma 54-interacting transcriptional regulator [Desulfobulbus sp.]|nr:sigma 54-interacting transcriptional regulator [Desulfobulbus sp.]